MLVASFTVVSNIKVKNLPKKISFSTRRRILSLDCYLIDKNSVSYGISELVLGQVVVSVKIFFMDSIRSKFEISSLMVF